MLFECFAGNRRFGELGLRPPGRANRGGMGRAERPRATSPVPPLRGSKQMKRKSKWGAYPGLTPWAKICRPYGASNKRSSRGFTAARSEGALDVGYQNVVPRGAGTNRAAIVRRRCSKPTARSPKARNHKLELSGVPVMAGGLPGSAEFETPSTGTTPRKRISK